MIRSLTIAIPLLGLIVASVPAEAAKPAPVRRVLRRHAKRAWKQAGVAGFGAALQFGAFLVAEKEGSVVRRGKHTLVNTKDGSSVTITANRVTFRERSDGYGMRTTYRHLSKGLTTSTSLVRGKGKQQVRRALSYDGLDVALTRRATTKQLETFQRAYDRRPLFQRLFQTRRGRAKSMAVALTAAKIGFERIDSRRTTMLEVAKPAEVKAQRPGMRYVSLIFKGSAAQLSAKVKADRKPIFFAETAQGEHILFWSSQKVPYSRTQLLRAGVHQSLIGGDPLLFSDGFSVKRARKAGLSKKAISILQHLPTLAQYEARRAAAGAAKGY